MNQQLGRGEQAQPEPVRVHPVRIGSSQLHRHAVRHGGTETGPVHRRQPREVRACRPDAGRISILEPSPVEYARMN